MGLVFGNKTFVCQIPHQTTSKGIFHHSNPMYFSTPLMLLQLSVISIVSRLIDLCLKPLGQSTVVAQIFGGIIFGPSLLGHKKGMSSTLFPQRGTMAIETISTFGLMFFLFIIGVKMDSSIMIRPGRKAMSIGLSVFIFTLALPTSISLILKTYLPMDSSLRNSLPSIAASQSLTAFPVIVCLLTELKILNTDLGRLAISSSMFCDVIGISLTAISFSVMEGKVGSILTAVWGILSSVALLVIIVYIVRPAILWMLNKTQGKPVEETLVFAIFVSVLVAGFMSETIGQHYVLGPLILGLAMPDGPPLGAALVSKLDPLVSGLLYPTFLAVSGLKTDVFKIHFQATWVVGIIVLSGCLAKLGAVILPALYSDVPIGEAFVLGLVMNAKGIMELIVYNLWRDSEILGDQEFALAVISVIAVTAIITPLIKVLYDPSKQYLSMKRCTIQHAKHDTDFRILVCIHNQDSAPTIVNLLEVSHASEESPVAVIAILLVELVGRTTPILLAHQHQPTLETSSSTRSDHIINALRHYELHNEGFATVQSFTDISHFATMHDDICRVAHEKRVTIVIVPFHKQWAIDGTVESANRAIQTMNINVLEKAPCSVGILIDRGILSGSLSVLTTHTLYHVAVIFIGGADDVESLAYGARMAKHESVNLTVIRFLLFGSDRARDRKLDTDLIDELRRANIGNDHFVYQEEVVRDGVGLAACIRGMEDGFDLMIVGRHHQESPLLLGLDEWSECPELGVIGDILASPDFGSSASVLVVQQQRVGGNFINKTMQPVVNIRDPLVHDVRHDEAETQGRDSNGAWAISMEV